MNENITVLVTGGNRGLGRKIAEEFVARGAKVYAGARRPETVGTAGVIPWSWTSPIRTRCAGPPRSPPMSPFW